MDKKSQMNFDRFQSTKPDVMSIKERIAVAKAQIKGEFKILQSVSERDISFGLRMAVATVEKFGLQAAMPSTQDR